MNYDSSIKATGKDLEVALKEIKKLQLKVIDVVAERNATHQLMQEVCHMKAGGQEVITVGDVLDAKGMIDMSGPTFAEESLDIGPILDAKVDEVETYKEFAEKALQCSTFLEKKTTYFQTGCFSKVLGLKSECCVFMLHSLVCVFLQSKKSM